MVKKYKVDQIKKEYIKLGIKTNKKKIMEGGKMNKYNLLLNILEIISIICFIQIIAIAFSCVGNPCTAPAKLFWIIPSSLFLIGTIAFIGVGTFIGALKLKWKQEFWKKLRNYSVDAVFLIVSLSILNEYVVPVILLAVKETHLFEFFRLAILLVGLSVMIMFWHLRDEFKVK